MQKPRGVEISADDADQIDEALEFAIDAARVASENRTEQVMVLDLRGLSGIADFFVIGTGSSDRQMRAVADQIEKHARGAGRKPYRVADSAAASWILADYVDVVIHLFDQKHRRFYDLDNLWGDAPRIDWTKDDDDTARASSR